MNIPPRRTSRALVQKRQARSPRSTRLGLEKGTPATLAKLSPPRLDGVYPRRRLFRELDNLRRVDVGWIAAPAGAGKTTLVASYLAERRVRPLWYQLDGADTDLASFFHHFGIAVQGLAPRRSALPALTSEYLADIPAFARRFFRELAACFSSPCTLVLDDFHEVAANAPFCEAIGAGLAELAGRLPVLCISRTEPPEAFARLRANRQLIRLEWNALKLREAESQELARRLAGKSRKPAAAWVSRLHEQCEGWVAGLILMLDGARGDSQAAHLDAATAQPLFDYFAFEVFSRRPSDVREFLMLTALLPCFTAEMAQQLSGHAQARPLLDELVRHHHFTERHAEAQESYQYHPLFRKFLLAQARSAWGEQGLALYRRAAGRVLEQFARPDSALSLYLDGGDHESAVRLIKVTARSLVASGRVGVLSATIGRLPHEEVERDPWLQFWRASCLRMIDPMGARADFEKAYQVFYDEDEAEGCYLAWSGVVDTFLFMWDDFSRLGSWLARFAEIEQRFRSRVSRVVEDQAVCAMFTAHVYGDCRWEAIGPWIARADRVARQSADLNLRITTLAAFGFYYPWIGENSKCDALLATARAQVRAGSGMPLARLIVLVMESQRLLLKGAPDLAAKACREAETFAQDNGIRIMDTQICAYAVYSYAQAGDLDSARANLLHFGAAISASRSMQDAYGLYLSAYVHMLSGQVGEAEECARNALAIVEELRSPMTVAMCQLALARILVDARRPQEVPALLERALQFARAMRSHLLEFEAHLVHAWAMLSVGDARASVPHLDAAFALSDRHGLKTYATWDPALMARLCATALAFGAQEPAVRRSVVERNLVPPDGDAPENWPWPVTIRTLGGFELRVGGKPVRFATKAQKRPLELLRAIIALGSRGVQEEHITERLWPESDGDAAHRVFDTTLHRLRKLLGSEHAIGVEGGRVSLDPRYVWVDAWHFEHKMAGAAGDSGSEHLDRAVALYGGAFLGREAAAWALPMRERLRSMFLRAVEKRGHLMEEQGRHASALECYRRGIEVDPLAELLYCRLMAVLERLGQYGEGIAVYQRLREMLRTQIGVSPSADARDRHVRLRKLAESSRIVRT